ncbi:MAG TPA: hypothetical protein VKX30_05960 [Flavobacteriaceae bacterium]|nr:hypothetical protein [Flavobacteriaceae bacterium]
MKTFDLNRKKLADYILNKAKDDVLEKINRIIEEKESVIAYTAKGEPLTEQSYKTHIKSISKSVANGAKTYSTEEVKKFVLNRKK